MLYSVSEWWEDSGKGGCGWKCFLPAALWWNWLERNSRILGIKELLSILSVSLQESRSYSEAKFEPSNLKEGSHGWMVKFEE
ncbi:hypothetical protein AAC387_Pa11g1577 [Persea americana]